MAVTEHVIKSPDDSFTCCGRDEFHSIGRMTCPDGLMHGVLTCAHCGRYHILLIEGDPEDPICSRLRKEDPSDV